MKIFLFLFFTVLSVFSKNLTKVQVLKAQAMEPVRVTRITNVKFLKKEVFTSKKLADSAIYFEVEGFRSGKPEDGIVLEFVRTNPDDLYNTKMKLLLKRLSTKGHIPTASLQTGKDRPVFAVAVPDIPFKTTVKIQIERIPDPFTTVGSDDVIGFSSDFEIELMGQNQNSSKDSCVISAAFTHANDIGGQLVFNDWVSYPENPYSC